MGGVSCRREVVKDTRVKLTSWRVREIICLVVSLGTSMAGVVKEVVVVGEESRYMNFGSQMTAPLADSNVGEQITCIIPDYRFTTDPRTRNHIFIQHLNLSPSDAFGLITSFTSSLTAALLSHG